MVLLVDVRLLLVGWYEVYHTGRKYSIRLESDVNIKRSLFSRHTDRKYSIRLKPDVNIKRSLFSRRERTYDTVAHTRVSVTE